MPSENQPPNTTTTTNRRPTTTTTTPPPPEPEHLPCPRCDSTNTKFCYYNNYNFSQPRHFCKSCRRYWTHGGTLRDIPVGGGSRKNAKRSRLTTSSSTLEFRHMAPPTTTTPFLFPFSGPQVKPTASIETFTSLLNGNCNINNNNMFGMGFEEGGWGFGRGVWGFTGVGDGGGNGWHLETGDGECFSLPDLAISTPGMI